MPRLSVPVRVSYDAATNSWACQSRGVIETDFATAAAALGDGHVPEPDDAAPPPLAAPAEKMSSSPPSSSAGAEWAGSASDDAMSPYADMSGCPSGASSVSGCHRVRICRRGDGTRRHVLLLPATMRELLAAASHKLSANGDPGFTARRVFTADGCELSTPAEAVAGELLVFSAGEDMYSPSPGPMFSPGPDPWAIMAGAEPGRPVPLVERLRQCELELGLAPSPSVGLGVAAAVAAAGAPVPSGTSLSAQVTELARWLGLAEGGGEA
eukprot:scaffold11447_cov118-Isochrysis_galbana.AAC.2